MSTFRRMVLAIFAGRYQVFCFGWIEVPVVGVWQVPVGRMTLWRDYFDEASYRAQLPE